MSGSDHESTAATGDLDVLIVAYKNVGLLRAALASIREHLPGSRIAVWDNSGAEYDGVRELAATDAGVDWHLHSTNIGFAAGVNRLAATTGDHDFLLLNPDAELLGDLRRTRELLRGTDVAAVAPRVSDQGASERRDWDVAHRETGLVRALVDSAWYAPRLRGRAASSLYAAPPTQVSGYLTGACLAIRNQVWRQIGGFDEEYFLYGEEQEWQRRARRAGYRLLFADEDGVAHSGHGTVTGDPVAARRSGDLLRANVALNLEQKSGKRIADTYVAGCSVLDRVQRSSRRSRKAYRESATRSRPQVVITTNRLVYGGAERQHVLLATELDRRGYQVTIACIQRFGPLIAEVPAAVRVLRLPWWAPAVDLGDGPAVLIGGDTNTETGFATLWRAAGRNRSWLVASHMGADPFDPTYSAPLAAAMRRADGYVALSPSHWADATAHQRLNGRPFFAPNGVLSAAQVAETPQRPRSTTGRVRLVMLARIVELKNPHLLMAALSALTEFDWTLDIFGDGPDRARLESMTPPELADRVRWRGWVSGPDVALADADVLCVPSRSEAFPLVILEAMARRIPVMASGVGSIPDMLDHGAAGIVVTPVTIEAWRAALREVLTDPARLHELGNRGFDRMAGHYTIDTMADAYENAIDAVIGSGAR